jgi:hypothetical protein
MVIKDYEVRHAIQLALLGMFQIGPIWVYSLVQPVAQNSPGVYG